MGNRVLVVAEAGVNHNGDITLAERLIDAAAAAGADFVKFQTFTAKRLVTQTAKKAAYQQEATGASETQFDMLRRLELDHATHLHLSSYCVSKGIRFLSTAFDELSVDFLVTIGIPLLKVPSGELTNLPFLRHVASQKLPVILSTGMATQNEVGQTLKALEKAGLARSQVTVLHCTTDYPTAMDDVNLNAMLTIRKTFGVEVGYSDHTLGIEVAIAAVALGATLVEKHFTLDKGMPGPDHRASLEPAELKAMVSAIRNVEAALGDGTKAPRPVEERNKLVARKSIVASTPIKKGDLFSAANLCAKRPGTGVSPMRWDEYIGRPAGRDYSVDELIDP